MQNDLSLQELQYSIADATINQTKNAMALAIYGACASYTNPFLLLSDIYKTSAIWPDQMEAIIGTSNFIKLYEFGVSVTCLN